jgi:BsuBI/PstI restriction endonuclease domain/BsuBI/PstI restriction endonuclease HTH domain
MNAKQKRVQQALNVIKSLDLPKEQHNDRTAICLLALLNLSAKSAWSAASNPLVGIRAVLDFARTQMDIDYAENTRESIRKYSIKALVSAGIVLHNPDDPTRSVNSSKNCYQIESAALVLLKQYGTTGWDEALKHYLAVNGSLRKRYAQERDLHRLPLITENGAEIGLSPGAHSELIIAIIKHFGANFVPGGELVYVGDTGTKWGYFDNDLLSQLGVTVGVHGKMPDVVIYDRVRHWLVLVEAVASSGPVDSGRHAELAALFNDATAGLVYVTAFSDKGELFRKFLSVLAWETEVWCASDPTHMIHFNGVRFLGPYETHNT